eukprot:XP_016659174.1 PREDICTED: multiple inositol polyphosphate phosphatase 1 isoform X2 [Acyrthosiphon pisum]
MLALVTAILCSSIGHIHSEDQCNGLYSDYSHHLSSKTPYRYVANHDIEPVNFEGCKAWKIWLVQRHGTRTPGKELDQFVKNRLPEIQKDIVNNLIEHKLCNEDEIKLWTSHEEIDDKKRLTKEGEDELLALAERMQLRFPNLLNQPYESTNFLFRFTDTQRTRISAKQFATGLFGRNDVKKVLFDEPLAKDPLLRLFEYSEDLKHYLIDGYAYELSYKQACVLLKNAIEYFDDQDLNSKNGIFYFTHSGTILKMLGLLGLYKDEHKLKHDNYFKMENRLWRTSKIDPFGSNIAFVLYKCNNNETKILTLHQERIVHINGCKDDLCSYEKFKQLFATELKNCNFDEMCNID